MIRQTELANRHGSNPGSSRPRLLTGAISIGTTVVVESELLLVAFKFGPADIAFVMIFDHHVAPPCPSVDDRGAFLAFPQT